MLVELVLFLICQWVTAGTLRSNGDRNYRVEIERASNEMREGVSKNDIDLNQYHSITEIRLFEADEDYKSVIPGVKNTIDEMKGEQ